MPASTFALLHELPIGEHEFRVFALQGEEAFRAVAREYVALRTRCEAPTQNISLESLGFSTAALHERLRCAAIPPRVGGNFDVVRSDFGETIAFLLLGQEYGTQFGYQGVRDRETVRLPGRGIDVVGVEDDPVTLVLGEVKVSNDVSPPRVVDVNKDGLRAQHLHHISHLRDTIDKVWDMLRRARDPDVTTRLASAALYLERERWDMVQLVACSILIRPQKKYQIDDFGSFRQAPAEYAPAHVRFMIVCVDGDVEAIVDQWYEMVTQTEMSI